MENADVRTIGIVNTRKMTDKQVDITRRLIEEAAACGCYIDRIIFSSNEDMSDDDT